MDRINLSKIPKKFAYRKRNYFDIIQLKDIRRPIIIVLIFLAILILLTIIVDEISIKRLFPILINPTVETLSDVFGNAFGGMMVGFLALVITVVAFIVEMAANKYTSKITDLFINDRINIIYISCTSVITVYVIFLLYIGDAAKDVPKISVLICTILVMALLLSIFPYFIFIFRFIQPGNIVYRIESDTFKNVIKCFKVTKLNSSAVAPHIQLLHKKTLNGINELTDITLNCIQNKDQSLAIDCTRSLRYLLINYMNLQSRFQLPEEWLELTPALEMDVSFLTSIDECIGSTIKSRLWFEDKLFKQFELIFRSSLNIERTVCNFIGKSLYMIGVTSLHLQNYEIMRRVIRYFNTFIRSTINEGDIRTCYNVLYQYRKLAEEYIRAKENTLALQISNYFKFYGLFAKEARGMYLILETVAHDLCDINKTAFEENLEKQNELLDIFLTVDMPLEGEKGDSLRGIRKAQILLAVFYLSKNTPEGTKLARKIYYDMLDELHRPGGYERIFNMIKELKYVKQEFWEINDRGYNFDYSNYEEKKQLQCFLNWFNIRLIIFYAIEVNVNKNNSKAYEYLKDFGSVLSSLTKEIPAEILEFESILGIDNLDTIKNYSNHIYSLKDKLTDINLLKEEILNQNDLDDLDLDEHIDNIIEGIKRFFVHFRII